MYLQRYRNMHIYAHQKHMSDWAARTLQMVMDKRSLSRLKYCSKCYLIKLQWRVFDIPAMFSLLLLSKGLRLKDKQDHTCDSTQQDFARAPSMRHMCDTPFFCHLYCATALFYDAFPSPLLSIHPGFLDHIPPCLELSWCSSCVELLPTVIRSNILSSVPT